MDSNPIKWSASSADIEKYSHDNTQAESDICQQLVTDTEAARVGSQMLSGRMVGQLLQMLVRISRAKTVLDVGTYTGYSALNLAESLPADGKVITLERCAQSLEYAKQYFAKSEHGKKIEPLLGEALELIPNLSDESIDLAFVDAKKRENLDYYAALLPKIKIGGLMIIDDVLWPVLRPKDSIRAEVVDKMNQAILADPRVINLLLPVRHGVNMVQRVD